MRNLFLNKLKHIHLTDNSLNQLALTVHRLTFGVGGGGGGVGGAYYQKDICIQDFFLGGGGRGEGLLLEFYSVHNQWVNRKTIIQYNDLFFYRNK